MITNDVKELRGLLRRVLRGLRGQHGPHLMALHGEAHPLGRRHVAVLTHVAAEGPVAVSDVAAALGLSLPAVSMLTRELEDAGLVERREDPADRRRTVVAVEPSTGRAVGKWLRARDEPLERALASLDEAERAAFLKGLRALADALVEESPCDPLRSHHRRPHRRGPHPHRPV
jgi:DNA-binding MarR family transcriptional regulator